VVVDHDVLKSSTLETDLIPFDQAGKVSYSAGFAVIEAMEKQEHSVNSHSTCNYQKVVDTGRALARKYGYNYWYVECTVNDIDPLDKRLRDRTSQW
jgi:hypothetical protein